MSDPTIPTRSLERTLWVQGQLRLKGSSFAAIARQHGWKRRGVAMAMHVPSYPQEKAIADELGLSVPQLFPERYDQSGNRLHPILSRDAFPRERSKGAA